MVKCLAAAGQFLASGGADDLIHLYDLKTDKDLSFLMNPGEGAVTALEFFVSPGAYNPTHLLSGGCAARLGLVVRVCVHVSGRVGCMEGETGRARLEGPQSSDGTAHTHAVLWTLKQPWLAGCGTHGLP